MKISSRAQHAIKAMIQLAVNDHAGPVSLASIGGDNDISVSYLEQIMSKLRDKNLVESVRGPGGGYRLARRMSEITLAQIVSCIDGDKSTKENQDTDIKPSVAIWKQVSSMMFDHLNNITLLTLLEQNQEFKVKRKIRSSRTSSYISSMFKPTFTADSMGMSKA